MDLVYFEAGLALFLVGLLGYAGLRWRQHPLPPGQALGALLAPPRFEDDALTRQADLLAAVMRPLGVLALVLAPLIAYMRGPDGGLRVLLLGLWIEAVIVLAYILMHRGRVRVAGNLLLVSIFLVLTVALVLFGGVTSSTASGYIVLVVAAGLLRGGRSALLFAVLSGLALWLLYQAEIAGWLPTAAARVASRSFVIQLGIVIVTALLLRLAARRIQDGLAHADRLRALQAERARELSVSLEAERKRAQQMELLADIARQLTGLNDPQALMDAATRRVCEGFGYDRVKLYLVEDESLALRAVHSLDGGFGTPGADAESGPAEMLTRAVRSGETYWFEEAASEQRFALPPGVVSAAAVPLRLAKSVVGVLSVECFRPGVFDPSDVRTLESLSDLLVAGLQACQLFARVQTRQQTTEALRRIGAAINASLDAVTVLETVCAETCSAFAADQVEVWLLETGQQELQLAAAHGSHSRSVTAELISLEPADSPVVRALRTGRAVLVSGSRANVEAGPLTPVFQQSASALVAPLLKDQQSYGVIMMGETQRVRPFGAEEATAAELLGAQLAAALQNARLYADHRRRAEQLALLNDITRASLEIADFGLMLETLADRLSDLVASDGCLITWWDESRKTVVPATGSQSLRALYRQHNPDAPGQVTVTEAVLRAGHALAVDDARQSPFFDAQVMAVFPIRSVLAVPLIAGGQRLGAVLITFNESHQFQPDEVAYAEQAARQIALATARARALDSERRRNAELETLREASLHLTSSLQLREVLEAILHHTLQLVAAQDAHIFLYDGERLTFGAALWSDGRTKLPFAAPRRGGLTDTVARTGQRVVVPDTDSHPLFQNWKWGGAIVGLPLRMGDRVRGVMNVAFEQPRVFDDHELRVLELLGDQAAVALENASLFEAEQHRAAQLGLLAEVSQQVADTLDEALLLQRAVAAMVNRLGFAEAAIFVRAGESELELAAVVTAETTVARPGLRLKIGQGVAGHAAEIRATYRCNDLGRDPYALGTGGRTTGSAIALPLLRDGELLGVLYLETSQQGAFSPADVVAYEALANHITTALENARLYARARDRLRDMTLLQSVSQAIVASLDLDEIFRTVVHLLHDSFNYPFVSLYELRGDTLWLRAYLGYPETLILQQISVNQGVSGRAVRSQRTQWVQSVADDPDFLRASTAVGSEICVPLLKEQTVLGTLNVESGSAEPLSEADVSLLNALAAQVTVAIENARLFTGEREQRELAEALREASIALTGSLDFDTVLAGLLDQIGRVVPYDAANVMLLNPATNRVHVAQQRGYERFGRDVADAIAALTLDLDRTPNLADMRATGRPWIISDTHAHPEWIPVAATGHVRSWAGAPVIAQGEVIAFFSLDKVEPGFYRSEHAERLSAFAGQAALALQNARLFAAEQRRAEEQRLLWLASRDFTAGLAPEAVLRAVAQHMTAALQTAGCAVSSWDSEHDRLVTLFDYSWPDPNQAEAAGTSYALADYPATRQVLESRQPLIITVNDPSGDPAEQELLRQQGQGAVMLLPLVTGSEVFGLIELFRAAGAPGFSEGDQQLAQSLAAQAGVALDNAHLHAALQENVRELDALLKANQALLSTLELEPLLQNILSAAAASTPAAEKGLIILVDPEAELLRVRAVFRYSDPRVRGLAYELDQGLAGRIVRHGEPVLVSDTTAEPAIWYDGGIGEIANVRSAILAPLSPKGTGGPAQGVISLDSTRPGAFTPADLRRLRAFATTAAVAIDNARLHAEVQRLAVTDSLTGLANPRAFEQALLTEVTRAARYGHSVSLIIMDIDSFKQFNDAYGHPAGNERLKAIAAVLRETVRDPDLPARYGGEEFALLLPHTTKEGALALAERIREAAEAAAPARPARGQPLAGYTLSLGVANFPSDALSAETLLLAADNAELAAKRAGKNRVVVARPLLADAMPAA